MIDGVTIKKLIPHHDERGYFMELIRVTDPMMQPGFGQWSLSWMHDGIVKAWHIHERQWDLWHVPVGALKLALADRRASSPTFGQTVEVLMGQPYPPLVVAIPPGVAHGCKVLQGPALLMYITSRIYDPADEGRIAHDDPAIGYDWLKGAEIK